MLDNCKLLIPKFDDYRSSMAMTMNGNDDDNIMISKHSFIHSGNLADPRPGNLQVFVSRCSIHPRLVSRRLAGYIAEGGGMLATGYQLSTRPQIALLHGVHPPLHPPLRKQARSLQCTFTFTHYGNLGVWSKPPPGFACPPLAPPLPRYPLPYGYCLLPTCFVICLFLRLRLVIAKAARRPGVQGLRARHLLRPSSICASLHEFASAPTQELHRTLGPSRRTTRVLWPLTASVSYFRSTVTSEGAVRVERRVGQGDDRFPSPPRLSPPSSPPSFAPPQSRPE